MKKPSQKIIEQEGKEIFSLLEEDSKKVSPEMQFKESFYKEMKDSLQNEEKKNVFVQFFDTFRFIFSPLSLGVGSFIIVMSFLFTSFYAYSNPTITNEHGLYFLKNVVEDMDLALTFSKEAKAKKHILLAQRRKDELAVLIADGKSSQVTVNEILLHLEMANDMIQDDAQLSEDDDMVFMAMNSAKSIKDETERLVLRLEEKRKYMMLASSDISDNVNPSFGSDIQHQLDYVDVEFAQEEDDDDEQEQDEVVPETDTAPVSEPEVEIAYKEPEDFSNHNPTQENNIVSIPDPQDDFIVEQIREVPPPKEVRVAHVDTVEEEETPEDENIKALQYLIQEIEAMEEGNVTQVIVLKEATKESVKRAKSEVDTKTTETVKTTKSESSPKRVVKKETPKVPVVNPPVKQPVAEQPPVPEPGRISQAEVEEEVPQMESAESDSYDVALSDEVQITVSSRSNSDTTCQDGCQYEARKCEKNDYVICGDFDSDSCYEWSEKNQCPKGTECEEGECIHKDNACKNECDEASKRMCGEDNEYYICGDFDDDPCLEWGEENECARGLVCMEGVCKK